jgi:hypothetical protein
MRYDMVAASTLAVALIAISTSGGWADSFSLPSTHFDDIGSFGYHGMDHDNGGGGSYSGGDSSSSHSAPSPAETKAHQLNQAGNKAYGNRDFDQAAAYYQEALRYEPNDGVIQQNLKNAQVI